MHAMQAMSAARRALVLDNPFFGVLCLKLEMIEDNNRDTMATDGKCLYFNAEFVQSLTQQERVGVVAHEVLHCANGHIWRRGSRDGQKWNHACDYAINPIVVKAGMVLPEGALFKASFEGKSAEEIYVLLENEEPSSEPSCGEVVDCPPDDLPERQADWSSAVLAAAKHAESAGKLPDGIDRLVERIKNPPQDWRSILRKFVQQSAMTDYSWKQPNGRYLHAGIYMPKLQAEAMGMLVVAVDTSGSIDEVILGQFEKEIDSISLEMRPEKIIVVYCDSDVRGTEEFLADDLVSLTPKGGGGTDFRPVFKWVENEGITPACLVYLTDMLGKFPEYPPDYPVLWGDTYGRKQAPWGETVIIECM
ncbi:MAG: vWA domain-containing protein [Burkholderiales bacterium]